jgi:hypothetical protein
MTETQLLEIGTLELLWSDWHPWQDFFVDARSGLGVMLPNKTPGVYEVRYAGKDTPRLHIGKASDLRMRVRQGLVKGLVPHSTGIRIRAAEDPGLLEIRWAVTERPSAAEEELHRLHILAFGALPTYTKRI